MKKSINFIVFTFVFCLFLLSTGAVSAQDEKTIYFGLPAQLTGADTYIHGELLVNAATLAVDEINEAGGVLGYKIALKPMDDAGDPKQGVSVANAFCNDPSIVAVLGHPYSGITIPALEIYSKCNMPVATHGSSPVIPELGYNNIIANPPNDFISGQAAADYAKDVLKVNSVAIINNKSLWGQGVSSVFKQRVEELGIKVTSFQGVDPEDVDFTPVLTKVKSENPDLVYFAGYTEQGLFRKQMVALGMTNLWMAAEATSSEYIDVVGKDGIGTISPTGAPPLDLNDTMKAFAAKFEAKYGKLPESWSPYYYDKVYAIVDVIKKANSVKREDIIAHIHEADIPSVVYPKGLSFDEKGRVKYPVTFIYELGDDLTYKVVYTWEGDPPHVTMPDEEYQKLIRLLQNKQ